MGRQKKGSFKMKGHTLPGVNQKSEIVNKADGRSPSSAFQMKEAGDSPNKFLPLLGAGALLGKTKLGKKIGKGIGNFAKKAGGALLGGGIGGALTGGGNEDAEAGKELLKEEAKAAMEGEQA